MPGPGYTNILYLQKDKVTSHQGRFSHQISEANYIQAPEICVLPEFYIIVRAS